MTIGNHSVTINMNVLNLRQTRYPNTRAHHKPKSHHQNKRNEFKSDYYHGSEQYSRCWKYGLCNHNAETCFHKFELQCRSCHNFGHSFDLLATKML